jgi:hypothetical protein
MYIFIDMDVLHENEQCYVIKDTQYYANKW